MKHNVPRSPFATRLSGSAKEAELRVKNIVQGPKKRPPLWLTVLAALAVLSCGSLVSCQPEQEMILYDDPSSLTQSMVDQMYQEVAEQSGLDLESGTVEKTLMSATTIGDYVLTSACIRDDYPRYTLALGVSAPGESELTGPAFLANNSGGMPHVRLFEKKGKSYLLYTANGSGQGYSQGEAGLVTLDGGQLTWLWPVKGDVRDQDSTAYHNYRAFWENQKALLSPGGVDIFVENHASSPHSKYLPQWTPDRNEQFYPTPEDELPIGVMYQARVWLEEYTRDDDSPWQGCDSAVWSIVGLEPYENSFSGQLEQEQAYSLTIQSDVDFRQIHTFTMMFDREAGTMR